jgi:hypothetical protein
MGAGSGQVGGIELVGRHTAITREQIGPSNSHGVMLRAMLAKSPSRAVKRHCNFVANGYSTIDAASTALTLGPIEALWVQTWVHPSP